MSIEVERKFLCNADTVKTLEALGAVCIGQWQFHDQYFDTPDFDLTLRNMWLRKRRGCWELKYPITTASKREGRSGEQPTRSSLCTHYKEITNLPEIQLRVGEVIKGICRDTSSQPLAELAEEERTPIKAEACCNVASDGSLQDKDSWLSEVNLECFAEFTTVRRTFTLDEDGVQIDLDHADFGYYVGEIEVLLPDGGDMQCAQDKIQRTADKLGLSGDKRVEGKIDVYLQRNLPEHYAKLLSTHFVTGM
ncbi:thiamine-triphosphatase [Thalassophryne amazonica]|uniref:thiamine-triphosphatase n=1 Tax=Thalassophryne amazonica TaxID=390379 RepID=UPI001470CF5D|nr:thiamine-triphosphatase [Thalassophryne amazonica]